MKKISLLRVISAILFLAVTSSCISGKDQLEYADAPYKEYCFGKNNELSMQLPTPVFKGGGLYSNILRREWIGAGFIDYHFISKLNVVLGVIADNPQNMISIQLNSSSDNISAPGDGFAFFREFVVIVKGFPIVTNLLTSMYEKAPFSKTTIDRFLAEDNALFIKILESVRVKGDNGKLYKIKVDYAKLAEKMKEIAFKPNRPSDLFEIPYELVEAEPVAPVAIPAQTVSTVQGKN